MYVEKEGRKQKIIFLSFICGRHRLFDSVYNFFFIRFSGSFRELVLFARFFFSSFLNYYFAFYLLPVLNVNFYANWLINLFIFLSSLVVVVVLVLFGSFLFSNDIHKCHFYFDNLFSFSILLSVCFDYFSPVLVTY